jgi:hypothetical protein
MFTPALSREQRRLASDLRTRLTAALEPVVIEDNPKLEPLVTKSEELTREIAGIERGAGEGNLEEAAQLITNRRGQLHLVQLQISELQGARTKAGEQQEQKSAETLASLTAEARGLLIEIATGFQGQHKQALLEAVGQYANRHSAEAANVVRLIPWFNSYLKRIRAFQDGYTAPARLLEWLNAALKSEDFLMEPRS